MLVPSLYAVLDLVQLRPSLYLGWPDTERGKQFAALEMLIAGYALAVLQHQLLDVGFNSYAGFSEYLQQRFGWNTSRGIFVAVRAAAASDAEAWDSFWRLLDEYRDSQSRPNGNQTA